MWCFAQFGTFCTIKKKNMNFTNSSTPPWVSFTIFKLYKWYQIAQSSRDYLSFWLSFSRMQPPTFLWKKKNQSHTILKPLRPVIMLCCFLIIIEKYTCFHFNTFPVISSDSVSQKKLWSFFLVNFGAILEW